MSGNSFGKLFTITSFGESHGPALGCVIDGCPPGMELTEADMQRDLNRRKPGQSRFTTQRREDDSVKILSGVFEGKTTGTPIGLMIENTDQRSKDYSKIKDQFRPAHADFTYWEKYGIRDYRGGGRASARENCNACRLQALLQRNTCLRPVVLRSVAISVSWVRLPSIQWTMKKLRTIHSFVRMPPRYWRWGHIWLL